jgi:hypothetical protein
MDKGAVSGCRSTESHPIVAGIKTMIPKYRVGEEFVIFEDYCLLR